MASLMRSVVTSRLSWAAAGAGFLLLGWFLVGSSVGLAVMHDERCRQASAARDPACAAPFHGVLWGRVGAAVAVLGGCLLLTAVVLTIARWIRRPQSARAAR